MRALLLDIFHVFIIGAVYLLLIGGVLVLAGKFDNWTSRLYFWRRKKRTNPAGDNRM